MVNETQDKDSISIARARHKIRLILKHPTLSPDLVTNELGIVPNVSNAKGEKIVTPKGTVLHSYHPTNTWSYWIVVKERRYLTNEIEKFVNELRSKAAFFRFVSESGGITNLTIDMSGTENIGCTLEFDLLMSMSEMRVNFGFEVFPE